MTVMHFGVVEIPYSQAPAKHRTYKARAGLRAKAQKPPKTAPGNVTTGDVAGWLESRYHVMQHFWELHQEDIAKAFENSAQGSFETLLIGGRIPDNIFATAESAIEELFQNFLANRELDAIGYPGIPTQAGELGVSHRFKHPYERRASRPSFIDTGLYQSAFKTWVDR